MMSGCRNDAGAGWWLTGSIILAVGLILLPVARAAGPGFPAPERIGLFLLIDTLRFPDPADGMQYTYHGPRSWPAIVQVYPMAPAPATAGADPVADEAEAVELAFERLAAQGEVSDVQVTDEGARAWNAGGRTIEGRRLAVSYHREGHGYRGFVYVLIAGPEIVKVRMLAEGEAVKAREADRFIELAFEDG
jgi:hypothetical protein